METMVTPWLTLKQTAKYLNLSDRTVKKHIASGRLQRRKVGRKNLIHKSWIERFILSNGGHKLSKMDKEELQRLSIAQIPKTQSIMNFIKFKYEYLNKCEGTLMGKKIKANDVQICKLPSGY